MKNKAIRTAIAVCAAVLISGCAKDKSLTVTGSYTYKTSGTVTLMASELAGLDPAQLEAYAAATGTDVNPVQVGLYPEQGQMHIMNDGNDKVIITFNDLLGNADVAEGKIDGSKVSISGAPVKSARLTDGKDKIGAGMVMYSGQGVKHEDMLIIDMQYLGEFTLNGIKMTVIDSDVHCVAQYND